MQNVEELDSWTKTIHNKPMAGLAASRNRHPTDYVALIIGGQRNIGMLTALQYAQAGVKTVLLTARDVANLAPTITQLESHFQKGENIFHGLQCDPANRDSMKVLAETVQKSYGRLDIVVLNAGYSGDVIVDLTLTPPDSFQKATEVNYMGTFYAMHYLIPLLLASDPLPSGVQPGMSFVCIGSFAASIVDGPIANAQYCISKLGQARLCEYAAQQFSRKGLLVGCVHPGAVNTNMARSSRGAEDFLQCMLPDRDAVAKLRTKHLQTVQTMQNLEGLSRCGLPVGEKTICGYLGGSWVQLGMSMRYCRGRMKSLLETFSKRDSQYRQ